jgi:hypothetical protein
MYNVYHSLDGLSSGAVAGIAIGAVAFGIIIIIPMLVVILSFGYRNRLFILVYFLWQCINL